jgi:hypothetical protein
MKFPHVAKGVSLKRLIKEYGISKKELKEIKMLIKKHK